MQVRTNRKAIAARLLVGTALATTILAAGVPASADAPYGAPQTDAETAIANERATLTGGEASSEDAMPEGLGLIDTIVVRGEAIERTLPDAIGTRIFAGKKTTNVNLDELPPLASGQLREAFALIPGLLVSEVSNRSWASLSYRGLGEPHESWNILVLKDGIPVSPDPYNYPAAYYQPPFEAIERIEFVRGGASLLYGPQPGGALNYVTRRAPLDDTGVAGLAAIGSDNFSNLYLAGWTGNGTTGVQGYVLRVAGDGPRDVNSDFLTEGASITVRHEVGDVRLMAGIDAYQGEFGEPGGLSTTRFAADPRAGSTPFDQLRVDRVVGFFGGEVDVGDWLVQGRLAATYYDRASRRQLGGSFGQPTPAANVSLVQSQKFRTLAFDLRARGDFTMWGGEQTFTVGTTLFGSNAPVTVDKSIDPFDWEGLAGPVNRIDRDSTVAAFFAEAALGFGAFTVTPGLRVERLEQAVQERLELAPGSITGGPPGAPLGALGARENEEWVVLPGLGLSWDFAPGQEAYANFTRGFKPVLFNDGLTFASGVNVAAQFESGYSFSSEIGVRGAIGSIATYDISVFRVELDNQVGFLAGPLVASPPFGAVGVGGARRQTVGSMRNQGLDIAGEVSLARLAGIEGPADVLWFANASLLDAEFTDGVARGNRPQFTPEILARTGLIARWEDRGELAFTGSYLSEHFGADNAAPEFRIAPYAVFDLTGKVSLTSDVSLFAAVNNIFDRRYIARVRPGGGQGIDPGAARTVSGGIRFAF